MESVSNPNAKNYGEGLSGLLPEEHDAVARTRHSIKRSSLVRKFRLILPVIAGGIIAMMFLWSDMDSVPAPRPREEVAPQTVGRNELINPKFQSEDKNQQPYTITAKRAVQNNANMDMIDLDKPVADVSLKSGAALGVEADQGQYQQGKQTLDLTGNVKLLHDKEYELKTDHVAIDIINQTAVSTNPVSGQGPAGAIESQGLRADGKTGILSFQGPATLTLNQNKDDVQKNGDKKP